MMRHRGEDARLKAVVFVIQAFLSRPSLCNNDHTTSAIAIPISCLCPQRHNDEIPLHHKRPYPASRARDSMPPATDKVLSPLSWLGLSCPKDTRLISRPPRVKHMMRLGNTQCQRTLLARASGRAGATHSRAPNVSTFIGLFHGRRRRRGGLLFHVHLCHGDRPG